MTKATPQELEVLADRIERAPKIKNREICFMRSDADNGDLNVADSPLYSKALNALRTAHEACFRSADRDVLGMSKGPFSGVNLALGIIKNLEKENTILKSMVLCAEAAIRADEREKCARVAERTPLNSYDAGECRADIAAAIRAGGDING